MSTPHQPGPRLEQFALPERLDTSSAAHPFTAEELEAAWTEWSGYSPVLADVMLVLGRTGLRWSEARAVTVGDADPELIKVDKAASEGSTLRRFPACQVRCVPVADRVRPVVRKLLAGRGADELLFTTSLGSQLNRSAVLRRLNWRETGHGRGLPDLRATAAFLWLCEGVEPVTVRTWLGATR